MNFFDRAYTKPVQAVSYKDFLDIVKLAWEEDSCYEDITSESIFDSSTLATATVVAKEDGVFLWFKCFGDFFSYFEKQIFLFSFEKRSRFFFTKKKN